MDALLYGVREAIWKGGMKYDFKNCRIMDDEHPPPDCGNIFVSIHQGAQRSTMQNALNELYGYNLTLTMRVAIPLDRVGENLLSLDVENEKKGWNRLAQQLKVFLHMNWAVLQLANQFLCDANPDAETVYGFCEPAMFANMDRPVLVGGEWFSAEPDAEDVGLKGTLTFDRCRRLQAIGTYT
jgi:hypothetical protein